MAKIIIETDDSGREIRGDFAIAAALNNDKSARSLECTITGELNTNSLELYANILPQFVDSVIQNLAKGHCPLEHARAMFLAGLKMLEEDEDKK